MKKIYFYVLITFFANSILINAEDKKSNEDIIKKTKETFERYFEMAHPSPNPDLFPEKIKKMQVPVIQSSEFLPFFLNSNAITNEESESYKMQNESSIAVNPTNPLNIIASAVDYRSESSTWVYVSQDGGKSWVNYNLGKPYDGWRSTNDPSVYFSSDGIAYMSYGGFGKIDENQAQLVGENGVFLAKSTDQGNTWKAHIPVIIHLGAQTLDSTFEDKYYVQVDNSPKSPYLHHLYNPWKRVTPLDSATQIVISKSTDEGETWSIPIPVSLRKTGTSEDTTYGQSFPLTTTGPNGEVYLVWNDGIVHGVGFAKSEDGGATFTEPRIIQNYNIFGTTKYIASQGGYRHTVKGKVRSEAYPAIQCDITDGPRSGYLYLTWAADSIPNVYFSRSTDKGETWSTPVLVHSVDVNDQFWQWIAIDPTNGDLAVMYLDSRDDPDNLMVDCYVSYSSDGGETWIDKRAGDVSHDLRLNPFLDNAFAGDYSGCAFYDGMVYPSWVDMRNAVENIRNSDVYTAIMNTRAPLPVENFHTEVIPNEINKLQIKWENPTTRSFGQVLNSEDFQLNLYRDGALIATLPGTTNSYFDENLTEYQKYDYRIYTFDSKDSSNSRFTHGTPGGTKNPMPPTIVSAVGFEENEKYGYDLKVKLPSLRADNITPLLDLNNIDFYLDSIQVDKISVAALDTGRTIDYRLYVSDLPRLKGYYKIATTSVTKETYMSDISNTIISYSAKPIDIIPNQPFTDDFDTKTPRKYYFGQKWGLTQEISLSSPNSLTESPNAKYDNRFNDTLLLFPIKMFDDGNYTFISFFTAAIVDDSDLATLEYSFDNGVNWTNEFANQTATFKKSDYSYWGDEILDERDWKHESLILPDHEGSVLLRFRISSNNFRNDEGWFIDDLQIVSDPMGVDENKQKFTLYPQIAKDFVKIINLTGEFDNSTITIYSLVGEKLFEQQVNNVEEIIEISQFLSGTYFIAVTQNGAMKYMNKFIKLSTF
ncbi:MAG: hypothetical protein A2X64_10050 [Ignavibacteria bacterium GWF2_33_9]|nr:MAG: hypothetical protein A2X64_10050 [Ignavibacteria bacterium GWF2_33_9]